MEVWNSKATYQEEAVTGIWDEKVTSCVCLGETCKSEAPIDAVCSKSDT